MVNQTEVIKQVPLSYLRREWMKNNGITNVTLAKRFDLSNPRISRIMNEGRCPQKYIRILKEEFMMPDALLPAPSRERPGPVPRAKK